MIGRACHGYLKNKKSYIKKNAKKSKKMAHLTVKNGIFKKTNKQKTKKEEEKNNNNKQQQTFKLFIRKRISSILLAITVCSTIGMQECLDITR